MTVAESAAPLTAREREQIEAVNASGRPGVVLIHGLWAVADGWKPWQELLLEHGMASVAVAWPREPETFEAALADPDAVAGVGIQEAADHVAAVIGALDLPPFVVGHSFGGLLAQKVAGLGLARATVAIEPAPIKGVLPLPLPVLRASSPVLANPANRSRAIRLTLPQFEYAWANGLGKEEARRLWETMHVAAPGRPLFQAAAARFQPRSEASVDLDNPARGPLLIIGGELDHLVAPAINRATLKLQSRNAGSTEFREFPGRGHSIAIDAGWREVADAVIAWLEEHAGP
ncbi:alpha/beta hydrolase [Demequina subtropica]|uniref:alpha/beta hydrolase n=1 Tax=Demequina subtropica TaxID=1638989 RepID=UPI000781DD2B|nr:alpha/beta hydrolase [Demequina subtropica]